MYQVAASHTRGGGFFILLPSFLWSAAPKKPSEGWGGGGGVSNSPPKSRVALTRRALSAVPEIHPSVRPPVEGQLSSGIHPPPPTPALVSAKFYMFVSVLSPTRIFVCYLCRIMCMWKGRNSVSFRDPDVRYIKKNQYYYLWLVLTFFI